MGMRFVFSCGEKFMGKARYELSATIHLMRFGLPTVVRVGLHKPQSGFGTIGRHDRVCYFGVKIRVVIMQ
jgi:hypothetical protein